jgi:DNA-binding transcriptional MocR family regulator
LNLEAIKWAREYRARSAAEMAVLWAIATRVDDKGECFPSRKRLAKDAAVNERTARRILTELEERGVIEREEREFEGWEMRDKSKLIRLRPICATSVYPAPDTIINANRALREELDRDPYSIKRWGWRWADT